MEIMTVINNHLMVSVIALMPELHKLIKKYDFKFTFLRKSVKVFYIILYALTPC